MGSRVMVEYKKMKWNLEFGTRQWNLLVPCYISSCNQTF